MGSAASLSGDVISTMDDASLVTILKEAIRKDPNRVDRLIANAKQAIKDENAMETSKVGKTNDDSKEIYHSGEDFINGIVTEINSVRTNPQSYIVHCEAMLEQFNGNVLTIPSEGIRLQTDEGPIAVQDCIAFLKSQSPVEYLVADPNMSRAALDHALDLGNNGAVSHTGSDGSTMIVRLEKYGEWKGSIGELLAFGLTQSRNIVLQLLIDDGVPSRGDRISLLDNKFKSIGVGFHTHKFQKHVCVLDFAGGFGPLGRASPLTQLNALIAVEKLSTPKVVTAQGEITHDVELILQSIPFDELKIEVREVLENAPTKSVLLNYKPGSIEVTVTNPDGSSQIKSGTWGIADPTQPKSS